MVANLKMAGMSELMLMADGRETSLREQALNAVQNHEQSTVPPSDQKLREIIAFEVHQPGRCREPAPPATAAARALNRHTFFHDRDQW